MPYCQMLSSCNACNDTPDCDVYDDDGMSYDEYMEHVCDAMYEQYEWEQENQ